MRLLVLPKTFEPLSCPSAKLDGSEVFPSPNDTAVFASMKQYHCKERHD